MFSRLELIVSYRKHEETVGSCRTDGCTVTNYQQEDYPNLEALRVM